MVFEIAWLIYLDDTTSSVEILYLLKGLKHLKTE